MPSSAPDFLVRFPDPSDPSDTAETVGVGFVVDSQRVLTCAHVVNAALGRDHLSQEQPDERRDERPITLTRLNTGGCAWAPRLLAVTFLACTFGQRSRLRPQVNRPVSDTSGHEIPLEPSHAW
ncbi:MAG: hypothetical protein LC799_04795 [Actinobacteria bacterium]|nr:hypothetical protein [Actinomycetota bacterium]